MAKDWIDVLYDLEAYYPAAAGVAGVRDEALRSRLVGYANNAFKEIERVRRWSLAYGIANIVTVQGTATYAIPSGITTITNVYYLNTTGGAVLLRNFSAMELRRTFGEGALSQQGPPTDFSVLGTNLQIFPAPDFSGPTAGNYTLIVEGYQGLTPIVETSGTTVATNATLTVPSTAYLVGRGVPSSGTTGLSVRNAGNQQFVTVTDQLVTNWIAFPLGSTVTMVVAAVASAANTQVFFNSTNWLITDFPKVLEFAVCREIATYKKSQADYQLFEQRFQGEMERMSDHDADRLTTLEQMATVQLGQRMPQLRRLDSQLGWEVRGGSL